MSAFESLYKVVTCLHDLTLFFVAVIFVLIYEFHKRCIETYVITK